MDRTASRVDLISPVVPWLIILTLLVLPYAIDPVTRWPALGLALTAALICEWLPRQFAPMADLPPLSRPWPPAARPEPIPPQPVPFHADRRFPPLSRFDPLAAAARRLPHARPEDFARAERLLSHMLATLEWAPRRVCWLTNPADVSTMALAPSLRLEASRWQLAVRRLGDPSADWAPNLVTEPHRLPRPRVQTGPPGRREQPIDEGWIGGPVWEDRAFSTCAWTALTAVREAAQSMKDWQFTRTRQARHLALFHARCRAAAEAGIGALWATDTTLIVIPRPMVHGDAADRFHREDGPAMEWTGLRRFYWHGVEVDERIILDPGSMTVEEIDAEPNVERRRVMIERFGRDRYLETKPWMTIHQTTINGSPVTLLQKNRTVLGSTLTCLRVRNATPEADGSRKEYMIRVPSHLTDARRALAWTFNLSPGDYLPTVET